MRAAKVQASLRIRAVSPEPSLLAYTSSESRGIVRQKARSLAPLNDWACAVKICHDGMLEDTNSLDGAHIRVATVEFVPVLPLGAIGGLRSKIGGPSGLLYSFRNLLKPLHNKANKVIVRPVKTQISQGIRPV